PMVDEFHLLTEYGMLDQMVEGLKAEGCHVRVYPDIQPIIERHAQVDAGDLPVRLKQPLYDYQKKGALFLALNGNALLADEMGLGKTVQAISAFEYLKREGAAKRALVVAPASLKLQWGREIEKFSDESYLVVQGDKDARAAFYRMPASIYIVNYELVLKDFDALAALKPDIIILDEAQRIKNFQSKTSQLIRQLPKKYAFALTGTPLENQLMELYTIMRFINPEVLGTNVQKFMNRYVVKNFFGGVISYKHVDEVRKKVSAVILRRTKKEVMKELPERVENTFRLELSEPQSRLYKAHKNSLVELLKKREEWTQRDLHQAFGHLTYLIEICDTTELLDEDQRHSSKLDELHEILEPVLQSDHKVLLFSQYERMTAILERELSKKKIKSVRFYGQLNEKERQDAIDAFMTQPDIRIFISTDAGALGLNLQAADYVINYDLPWNPAKLEQRIARAHRIGQKRTVNVVNLVTTKTVESGILKVLYRKRKLFAEIFDYLETEKLLKNATQARDLIAALLDQDRED
ncbi:MAG: DEAD/DEAH box helicase, partial [bacterium]